MTRPRRDLWGAPLTQHPVPPASSCPAPGSSAVGLTRLPAELGGAREGGASGRLPVAPRPTVRYCSFGDPGEPSCWPQGSDETTTGAPRSPGLRPPCPFPRRGSEEGGEEGCWSWGSWDLGRMWSPPSLATPGWERCIFPLLSSLVAASLGRFVSEL
jgi:hypothetical protein